MASGKTRVWQRIYANDGSFREFFVGEFVWHEGHNHWHFEKFALYQLWSLTSTGALDTLVATSSKVTYCIADNTHVDPSLPSSPNQAVYTICGQELQGLSVGWGDAYRSYLQGQSLDITSVVNGVYALKSKADPSNLLRELNDDNNAAVICIRINGNRVRVVSCNP